MSKQGGFRIDGPEGVWAQVFTDSRGGFRMHTVKRGSVELWPKNKSGLAIPKFQKGRRNGSNGKIIKKAEFVKSALVELQNIADCVGVTVGKSSPGIVEFIESTYKPEHIRRHPKDDFATDGKYLKRLAVFCNQSGDYPNWDELTLDQVDSYLLFDAEEWYENEARHSVTAPNPEGKPYKFKTWEDMSGVASRVIKRAMAEENRKKRTANLWNLMDPAPHLYRMRPRGKRVKVDDYELPLWEKHEMLRILWDTDTMNTGHLNWSLSDKLMASMMIVCGPRVQDLLTMTWDAVRWVDLDGRRLVLTEDHSKAGGDRLPYLTVPHGLIEDQFRRHELRSRGKKFVFWETAGCPESGKREGNWRRKMSTLISKVEGTHWLNKSTDAKRPLYERAVITFRSAAITEFNTIRVAHESAGLNTKGWDSMNETMFDNTRKIGREVYAGKIDIEAEMQGKITDLMFGRIMEADRPATEKKTRKKKA